MHAVATAQFTVRKWSVSAIMRWLDCRNSQPMLFVSLLWIAKVPHHPRSFKLGHWRIVSPRGCTATRLFTILSVTINCQHSSLVICEFVLFSLRHPHCLFNIYVPVPQAPPADVACASQQHSITVSWNPPHPNTINGILTEYHVSYFAANAYGGKSLPPSPVPAIFYNRLLPSFALVPYVFQSSSFM